MGHEDLPRRGPTHPPAGHHECINDVTTTKSPQNFILSAGRDGVVKIWKWDSVHLESATVRYQSTHRHLGSDEVLTAKYKPAFSQSCAVAKSEKFWGATGQSNLTDRMEHCSTGHSAVVRVWKLNFGSFCYGQLFVYQLWFSSGPPEFFTFATAHDYCTDSWTDIAISEDTSLKVCRGVFIPSQNQQVQKRQADRKNFTKRFPFCFVLVGAVYIASKK